MAAEEREAAMQDETREWLAGLGALATASRRSRAAAPSEPVAVVTAERAILAASLTAWFDQWATFVAARRRMAVSRFPGFDPDPVLVITTSPTGIGVVERMLGGGHPVAAAEAARIAAVTELEYRTWCMRRADAGHRWHVNHWDWLKTRVPRQREAEFARHPLHAGEAYWLQRTGTSGAGDCDRRDCHLWKWDGRHAALLQAFVTEAGVSRLAGQGGRRTRAD